MSLIVYYTSVSSSQEIKKKQLRIFDLLRSKKIEFETRDVASNVDVRDEMKAKVKDHSGKENVLPPQICKGDIYLGDFDKMFDAVEAGELLNFLRLEDDEEASQQIQQAQQF